MQTNMAVNTFIKTTYAQLDRIEEVRNELLRLPWSAAPVRFQGVVDALHEIEGELRTRRLDVELALAGGDPDAIPGPEDLP